MSIERTVEEMAHRAQAAARKLGQMSSGAKNAALEAMAEALRNRRTFLLEANAADMDAGRQGGLSAALLDRLLLTDARIDSMAAGLEQVARLTDPVGEVVGGWTRPNGLEIRKVRVPLGVVGVIYEARPNVTVDVAGLCLKSGNAVLLRSGKEALQSSKALTRVLVEAARGAEVPEGAIQIIASPDRAGAQRMMTLTGLIDVLVPRGGAGLIDAVVQNATVPVIETGVGNCHTYVDSAADLDMAEAIAVNAKTQRCSVCNAMETLLVHAGVAGAFLPKVGKRLLEAGVEIRGCPRTCALIPEARPATEEDWATEFLALVLAVKVVAGLEEALAHITAYGTRHSECIVTTNRDNARRFCKEIDAAAVYVNASTRFTDGEEFGLGAEVGISTQKLHARGPMGLEALTTTKFVIDGDGQIRE